MPEDDDQVRGVRANFGFVPACTSVQTLGALILDAKPLILDAKPLILDAKPLLPPGALTPTSSALLAQPAQPGDSLPYLVRREWQG